MTRSMYTFLYSPLYFSVYHSSLQSVARHSLPVYPKDIPPIVEFPDTKMAAHILATPHGKPGDRKNCTYRLNENSCSQCY